MKKIILTLSLLCLYSVNAFADSPSFTYVELEYVAAGDINVSDGSLTVDVGLDGYALNLSAELGVLILQASRFELETDRILTSNIEDSISTLALGLAFELPQTQVYGLVRARRDELSLTGGGFDEDEEGDSVGLEAGVRINVTDRLELNANVGRPAVDEGNSFGVGAQFFITNNLGITFDYSSLEVEDDDISAELDLTSVGVRFTF